MRPEVACRWQLQLALALAATLGSIALAFAAGLFSSAALVDAPAPSASAGKDNGREQGGTHYAGEDCGSCHTPGGKAGEHVFSISGTLYQDRLGSLPLAGAEVVLQDAAGHVLSLTSNAAGNFYSEAKLASNPRSVASDGGVVEPLYHDDVAADAADSRSWQYKAWVRDGEQVVSMIAVTPVGGADGETPRMSCNAHHSPTSPAGAIWVSRAPALTDYPRENISWRQHVRPIMLSKCAPCHVPGDRWTPPVTESDLDAREPTTVDYSGGSDFTAHGTYRVRVGDRFIEKAAVRGALNFERPELSELLTKPLIRKPGRVVDHPGGGFWTAGDPDYQLILRWIREGGKDN